MSVLASLALVACSTTRTEESVEPIENAYEPISEPQLLDDDWKLGVAYQGSARINGVACGELDADAPGDEIVAVDRDGVARLIRRRGDGFEATDLLAAADDLVGVDGSGELVQVAVGDLDPSRPGDEIVAVGMAEGKEEDEGPGAIRYYARTSAGGFERITALTPSLAHAVAIGDLIPERAGNEFVVAGYFGQVLIGYVDPATGTLLLDEIGAEHDGPAKGIMLFDGGFVLALEDGTTVRFERTADGKWARTEVKQHGAPLARIDRFGERDFVLCDNEGVFRLYGDFGPGGAKGTVVLERRESRMRGAVVADVDPSSPGPEAATGGYDGEVIVVRIEVRNRPDGTREVLKAARHVARDTAKLHHLAVGDIDGFGTALVSGGYSGNVLVVAARERDARTPSVAEGR